MRFRALMALLVVLSFSASISAGSVSARSNPRCNGKVATIVGSGEIVGTPDNDVIVGSKGHDVIISKGGIDTICGLDGDDEISVIGWADGGSGDDLIRVYSSSIAYGGSGDDELFVYSQSTAFGGPGNDRFTVEAQSIGDGGSGDDLVIGTNAYKLLGGSGKDSLTDFGGTQFMDCGSDKDSFRSAFFGDGPQVRRCENQEPLN